MNFKILSKFRILIRVQVSIIVTRLSLVACKIWLVKLVKEMGTNNNSSGSKLSILREDYYKSNLRALCCFDDQTHKQKVNCWIIMSSKKKYLDFTLAMGLILNNGSPQQTRCTVKSVKNGANSNPTSTGLNGDVLQLHLWKEGVIKTLLSSSQNIFIREVRIQACWSFNSHPAVMIKFFS